MECQKEKNQRSCPCPKRTCAQHGLCCLCILRHRANQTMPRCVYRGVEPPDRSIETFARMVLSGKL